MMCDAERLSLTHNIRSITGRWADELLAGDRW